MKAVVLREHGGLDNLQYVTDFPDPVATAGHVVIRVGATSFNYHDVFTVRGMPGIKVPMPMIIGLDMAGEILKTGPGVAGWKDFCAPRTISLARFSRRRRRSMTPLSWTRTG